ncbi:hypothetical protein C0Q70_10323 [Pomacea canaliculata]|uniref:Uncharacterized protein n=1 Tax=Pomacea canaliculata TaxID=400727 RepID=A0A2T7PCA5_POMCA|nr:hypothetical protein C0Q70_10323 [Pomacea canaliculata]
MVNTTLEAPYYLGCVSPLLRAIVFSPVFTCSLVCLLYRHDHRDSPPPQPPAPEPEPEPPPPPPPHHHHTTTTTTSTTVCVDLSADPSYHHRHSCHDNSVHYLLLDLSTLFLQQLPTKTKD